MFNQSKPCCTSFTSYGHNCSILRLLWSELKSGTSTQMDGGIDRAIQWFKFSDQTRVGMSALINPVEGISMELVQRGPVEAGDEILKGLPEGISIVELSQGRHSVFEDGGIQLCRDQWNGRVSGADIEEGVIQGEADEL